MLLSNHAREGCDAAELAPCCAEHGAKILRSTGPPPQFGTARRRDPRPRTLRTCDRDASPLALAEVADRDRLGHHGHGTVVMLEAAVVRDDRRLVRVGAVDAAGLPHIDQHLFAAPPDAEVFGGGVGLA